MFIHTTWGSLEVVTIPEFHPWQQRGQELEGDFPMSSMMIRCPVTDREVSTAIETEPSVFRMLPKVVALMHCPACGQDHTWTVGSAWLAGEPRSVHEVALSKVAAA
ncbi:MAG: hypothetical protein WCC81_23475 [Pseudolabrys sp.]